MIALVDCNNFYASCERLFAPKFEDKPVVVLSNNDGCIIARSNEAKALGIKMGAPLFKIEEFLNENNVAVFSSNYTLYGDLSSRVAEALNNFSPEVEIYSIDEAFITLPENLSDEQYFQKGLEIKQKIYKWIGIPVSVGIAPTKTLAKLANRVAKKCGYGVFEMKSESIQEDVLEQTTIGDIWGIGRRSSQKLTDLCKIETALELKYLDRRIARKLLTVSGARIVQELSGVNCIPLELAPPLKKNICCSRSFGSPIETYQEMKEALFNYLHKASMKMRKQNLSASAVTVFLSTNRFRKGQQQYSNSITQTLAFKTNSTIELNQVGKKLLKEIFLEGYSYKKVGVLLQGLYPEAALSKNLFLEKNTVKHKRLMSSVDFITEKYGRNALKFGKSNSDENWQMKSEMCSPKYTTNLNEIYQVT